MILQIYMILFAKKFMKFILLTKESIMFYDTTKLFYNTEPIDQQRARKAVIDLYSYCNKKSKETDFWKGYIDHAPVAIPEVVFVDGPSELKDKVKITNWTALERFNDIAHFVTKRGTGVRERVSWVIESALRESVNYNRKERTWDGPLLIAVDYLYEDKNNPYRSKYENKWEELATALWDEVYAIFTFCDTAYVINRPSLIKTKEFRGLHCTDGPALVFRDGTEVYCYEGIKVSKDNILNPDKMTLEDIHSHGSHKYLMIDLCGVDRYLEMMRAWKPDVKGMFSKFFSFPLMKPVPGTYDVQSYGENWKGYGSLYKKRPYVLKVDHQDINGDYCLKMECSHSMFAFPTREHPFDFDYSSKIFEEKDRKLWDSLNIKEMFRRGPLKFEIKFKNGIFSIRTDLKTDGHFPSCRREIAPAWFKAKLFRGQDAFYEADKYFVKYENGKLSYSDNVKFKGSVTTQDMTEDEDYIYISDSLFSGMDQLPGYEFDINLKNSSWEGLLKDWEQFSFEWLGME